jgi:hypothetical protein
MAAATAPSLAAGGRAARSTAAARPSGSAASPMIATATTTAARRRSSTGRDTGAWRSSPVPRRLGASTAAVAKVAIATTGSSRLKSASSWTATAVSAPRAPASSGP